MKLKEYLNKNLIGHSEFSRQINISYNALYHILEGKTEPKLSTAVKIVEATGGKVRYQDLILKDSNLKTQKSKSKNTKSKTKN